MPEGKSVSGVWSLVQQQEHINLLEMRAVILALQHFKTLLVSKAVVLATDNTTVVAYLEELAVMLSFFFAKKFFFFVFYRTFIW
jgi:ribonuclease HI